MTYSSTIRTHTDAGIHTILLNRPDKRNALTPELIDELTRALQAVATSTVCRVVIITGAGSAFCAGLDLDHLRSMLAPCSFLPDGCPPGTPAPNSQVEYYRADSEHIATLFRTLHSLPKPTIAAVNGPAIAGGMGIATLCDFTLAVPEAKFGYTEVRIGFIPALVSAYLRAQTGEKRSRELLLTGRLISAQEALEYGLVTRIVPEPELLHEARTLATRLIRNSPAAMAATKRLLNTYAECHLPNEIAAAIRASVDSRSNDDFREGVSAFLEKREPHWPSLKS